MYQIMLVEDEALVRESMAQNTNWEKFGFAPPHVFENGRQAADHLETVLPDVVITDICMPFLDGLELAKLVYERFPETIVVVLTGFSEFSYAQKAIRYHVHDYLLKPVSPKEFDQLLENLSAELSRRENRQGLYSRAVMADEVLKDHFFQSLLQTDAPQELPASMREAGAGLGGRLHAVALALPPARPEGIEARGQRVAEVCAPAQFRLLGGATYLDVNIGPAESNGPELMTWAVKLLQENFNNVPLALDTANKRAIEAGIKVYNRTNGKPIVNSADAGSRISYIDLAAANDAICIALCSADGIAKDNEERMMHCHHMLERGLSLGMEATDLWFDPLFLVVKGMQDKQMDVLNAIKLFSDEGLKSTGGLSNNSNGAPKNVRPIMDSALVAMAMMQGLTSAIVNPNDLRLMETIKSCDIFKNNELYSDSYLDA